MTKCVGWISNNSQIPVKLFKISLKFSLSWNLSKCLATAPKIFVSVTFFAIVILSFLLVLKFCNYMRIKVHIFLFTSMITLINFWKLWFQKSRTKSRSSLFMYHLLYSVILFSVFSMLLRICSWLRVRFAPSTQMLARSATSSDSKPPVNPDHAEIEIIQFCTVSKSQHIFTHNMKCAIPYSTR